MVMTVRMVSGKSPFFADKNHIHHNFMRFGLFHTESVFVIYMIQALLVTFAFMFRFYSEWVLLSFYLVVSGLLLSLIFLANRNGWRFLNARYF